MSSQDCIDYEAEVKPKIDGIDSVASTITIGKMDVELTRGSRQIG